MFSRVIPVCFFATESGKEPVREWLKNLTKEDRVNIGEDIKTLQIGWPVGMPLVKNIGDGLYEIRRSLQSYKVSRVIFLCIKVI